ncbi:MAG: leucine/isoleucine/valine transporter permease subunit, partial [Chloroflexota bacterium]|nr:leucine/isoleucine/valine transporter permease subunit [Chloroflexota bacterium]
MAKSKAKVTGVASSAILVSALKIGLVSGLVAVFIALEGMIQAFSVRDVVSGVVSMSQTLLLITFFASGYVAVSRGSSQHLFRMLSLGALAGLIASGLLVALIWLGGILPLGSVFVNCTAQLYDLLTFKQGLAGGSITLLILGLSAGAVAAIIHGLPSRAGRSLMTALVSIVALGVLQDLVRVTLSDWEVLTPVVKFFYATNGLSVEGVLVLLVSIGLASYVWSAKSGQFQIGVKDLSPRARQGLRWGGLALAIIVLLLLPRLLGLYLSEVLDQVGLYLLMGLGLNIVVGFAGLLDLGYVAFFAIGAYTMGVLTSPELGSSVIRNWWFALPFAVGMAVLTGVLLGIPVLRMRGDYLAIVTLGFGEIVRLLALSDFLKPLIGGAQGIQTIPKPDIGIMKIDWGPQAFYYVFLAGCLLAIFISVRLKGSRLGRAWMAVREDEDVAQAMGINLVATKLLAFGMG